MNYVSGTPLWTNITKVPRQYKYLDTNISCDIAIIGGGVTGAILSYYFSSLNKNIVLLEKNIIGYNATSGSTSILEYAVDLDLVGLSGLIGEDNAARTFKLTYDSVYEIQRIVNELGTDCGFKLTEGFYYSDKKNDYNMLKKEYELRKKHNFNVDFIEESKAKELFDFPVNSGIYSNDGVAYIDPYKFSCNLINHSESKGVDVYENTEIIGFDFNKQDVLLTTYNNFKIKAKKVIIATGFDASRLIDHKTAIFTRTFTLVTKPINEFNGWHKKCVIKDTNSPYTYVLPTSDNRIIIGGEDVGIGTETSKIANLTNDDTIAQQKFTILFDRLKAMFPNIESLEKEYLYSAYFAESKDSLPYIGEYEKMPNCYFCLGYGSNGILYAIIGAKILKDLYLGQNNEDLKLFRIDR